MVRSAWLYEYFHQSLYFIGRHHDKETITLMSFQTLSQPVRLLNVCVYTYIPRSKRLGESTFWSPVPDSSEISYIMFKVTDINYTQADPTTIVPCVFLRLRLPNLCSFAMLYVNATPRKFTWRFQSSRNHMSLSEHCICKLWSLWLHPHSFVILKQFLSSVVKEPLVTQLLCMFDLYGLMLWRFPTIFHRQYLE